MSKTTNQKPSGSNPSRVVSGSYEWGIAIRALFLVIATVFLLAFYNTPWLKTFALSFVSILLEAMPFMLLGSMVSGFIEIFVAKDRLAVLLPKRPVVLAFVAAGLGILFPVCECAIVPVIRRFLLKGVPFFAAVAYLLAGPIFNPIVGASTAVAYSSNPGWQTAGIVAIRLVSGFLIAVGVGIIMGRIFPGRTAVLEDLQSNKQSCGNHDHNHSHRADRDQTLGMRILTALNHGIDDFLDITQYLVMGAFFAGLLQVVVSRQVFLDLAYSPLFSIPLMMILALVLSLCSEADAFIAASFRGVLPLSAQMAFMVLGPMLDIKLLIMYLSVFRKKTIVVLASLVVAGVLLVMVLLHYLMGSWYASPPGTVPLTGP